jgi:hypothetical protein
MVIVIEYLKLWLKYTQQDLVHVLIPFFCGDDIFYLYTSNRNI